MSQVLPTTPSRFSRRARVVGALLLALTTPLAVLALTAGGTAAGAATGVLAGVSPHGSVRFASAAGGVTVSGWAVDADSPATALLVKGVVDGRTVTQIHTSVADPAVTAKYHAGSTPAFSFFVPVPAGRHTVCLVAHSVGGGLDGVLRCAATPLGTVLTGRQVAAHSPQGAVTDVTVSSNSVRLSGWAQDPDYLPGRRIVVVYLDGSPAATFTTTTFTGPRPARAQLRSAFVHSLAVTSGSHVACTWVVNVGIGANRWLGCQTFDTRGPAGTGVVPHPAVNAKILTEAEKHIGQPYVWGAEGPKRFDCSGLVQYSYGKNKLAIPRVSETQYAAARLIPAARAVPGDLVFYHDSEGDVYHVGIVSGPGMSVAAVDPQEGVTWQTIWPGDVSVSYGSFTHT